MNGLPELLRENMIRREECLNGVWHFKSEVDDEWVEIRVPGAYAGVRKSWGGKHWDVFDHPERWEGKGGTYRRELTIPDSMKGQDIHFFCGACAHHSRVLVNGQEIGEWHDGYTPIEFSITDALAPEQNTLEVEVSGDDTDLL